MVSALLAATPALAETTIGRGIVGTIETLDPQLAATANEAAILQDLFEGLITRDGNGQLGPGAAERIVVSPDGLVYTFELRPDARWSNGEAVKAEDFVASFRRLFDPATEATEDALLLVIRNAAAVKDGSEKPEALGVRAIGPQTLEIELERPTPTFPARLALPVALPVNVAAIKKSGAVAARTVSNGAYQLSSKDKNGSYWLRKNPRFRDAASVAIDAVAYRPFDSAASCVDAYRAGTVQICADVPADHLADLKAEFGAALRIAPYAGTYFYVFNTTKKPFDSASVRQALGLAIDREALARAAWSGGMVAAPTLVPAGLSGSAPPAQAPIDQRRNEARDLLAKAGYGPGKPLTLEIRVGSGIAHEQTAQLVAEQWREIGVEAKIVTEAGNAHFARLRDGGDFEVARAGWIVDEADPIDLLQLARSDNARFNYARYKNGDFDRLIGQAATDLDATKRKYDLAAAEAILARDVPIVPLLGYASLTLASPDVTGWTDNILNQHPTRYLGLAAVAP